MAFKRYPHSSYLKSKKSLPNGANEEPRNDPVELWTPLTLLEFIIMGMLVDFTTEGIISITEYYAGQSIFVTGGTGFMGKVLIEKILRSCPDVANVFVLIRPKKNVTAEERWSKITEIPLFEKLKSERPEAMKKIVLVHGDIGIQGLGLSDTHLQMLAGSVTLVYHVAAMIQFTDSIGDAFHQNVQGTWEVLKLAESMTKLKAFVYVSTAYSNFNKHPKHTREEILPACQDWKVILKIYETVPLQLEVLREKLLCGHPNPYTWSKSLAEQVVNEYRNRFPTIIMRPAVVIPVSQDPLPGWVDAANGYFAYSILVSYGIMHVTPTGPDSNIDFVPVDHAIKACLIAPWRQHVTLQQSTEDNGHPATTEVYNCATARNLLLANKDVVRYGEEVINKYPPDRAIWVQTVAYIENKTLFKICFLIYQVLPAVVADAVLSLSGHPFVAVKLMKKILNSLRLGGNIVNAHITFPNERFIELGKYLKEEDKGAFSYNVNAEGKKDFVEGIIIGFRKYFMKEDFSEEANKRKLKRMKRIRFLHTVTTSLAYFLAAYVLLTFCIGRLRPDSA